MRFMDRTSVAFGKTTSDLWIVNDDDFLNAIDWRRSSEFRSAAGHSSLPELCRNWGAALAARLQPTKTVGKHAHALTLWSRHAFDQTDRADAMIGILEDHHLAVFGDGKRRKDSKSKHGIGTKNSGRRSPSKQAGERNLALGRLWTRLAEWLDEVTADVAPIELLTLVELLETVDPHANSGVYAKLWRTTLTAALELSTQLDEPLGSPVTEDQRMLIAGELPWRLGLLFGDVRGADKLRSAGRNKLREHLLENTDTDGTPDAELLDRLPLWIAPLVRAAESARTFEEPLWDDESVDRFELMVSCVAPLCRPDGRIALTNGSSHQVVSLLQAASKVAGFRKDAAPRKYLQGVGKPKSTAAGRSTAKRRVKFKSDADMPAAQSDWAQLACLCSDWSVSANSIVVAHHAAKPLIDLTARGTSLLSGMWDIEVQLDGKSLPFVADDWECSCWQSDADCDYLELQAAFEDDVHVERQVLLSRTDDFLLLADVVRGVGERRIDYTSRLPLVSGIKAVSSTDTRECVLKDRGTVARVFPLALPDDRVLSTAGGFGPFENQLVLKQASAGDGLYAPLIIDWAPDRRRIPADWRSLTVTEARTTLKPSVAAGHRLRIGAHQLFIFRSLREADSSRAVLGHHTANETVIGHFDRKGEVQSILSVE